MFNAQLLNEVYGEKIPQRIEEYSKALTYYKRYAQKDVAGEFTFKEDIAQTQAYLYFHWLHTLVKPSVKELCDRYKVASITEFAICYLQPLHVEGCNEGELRAINADFAFFSALNIMSNFNEEDETLHFGTPHTPLFQGANVELENKMAKLLTNHKQYLATFDDMNPSPPLIVNAFCLEMIEMYHLFRWSVQA